MAAADLCDFRRPPVRLARLLLNQLDRDRALFIRLNCNLPLHFCWICPARCGQVEFRFRGSRTATVDRRLGDRTPDADVFESAHLSLWLLPGRDRCVAAASRDDRGIA